MQSIVRTTKYLFALLIDISGTIFGGVLMYVGWNVKSDQPMSLEVAGWIVFSLGVLSFSIHGTHYVWAKLYGSRYFRTTQYENGRKEV